MANDDERSYAVAREFLHDMAKLAGCRSFVMPLLTEEQRDMVLSLRRRILWPVDAVVDSGNGPERISHRVDP